MPCPLPCCQILRDTDANLSPYGTSFGGHGMYARLSDYLQVLRSLLANDGKLLSPASVDELFTPQLGAGSEEALNFFIQNFHSMIPGEFELEVPVQ